MSDKRLLSDDEVFGRPQGRLLTDAEVMGAPSTPAPAAEEGRSAWGAAKDLAASGLQGLVGISKLPAMAIDKAVTGQWVGPGVEALSEFEASVNEQKTPFLREKERASQERVAAAGKSVRESLGDEGILPNAARMAAEFGVGAWEAVKDPTLLSAQIAQQLPMLGASRLGGLATNQLARGAAAAAPKVAATKVGQLAMAGAGTAGAVATGAGLQGADIGSDAYQRLMALPEAQWREQPEYVKLADVIGPEAARSKLAADKAFVAAMQAGAASILSSALPGGASMERALVGKAAGGANPLATVARSVRGEAIQEGIEEGFGALAANDAVREVNPAQDRIEGIGGAAGQGAALGGIMGGGSTAAALGVDRWRGRDTPPALDPAATPPVTDAAEVLGAPEAAAEPAAEPTAAEKALRTPRPITALDRAQEIDQLLAAAPDAPESPALAAERAQIAATWPAMTRGQDTSFSTEAGARVDGRYALVEADALQASHNTDLRPNPAYPAELQPRDRTRAASEAQISSIVGKLDPARLGLSADAANGAPIVGSDGLVESGNARTIALQRIYRQNGQKAVDYKTWLRDNAAQFGLTPERIDGMRAPVLVRERTTPVDRAEFARQANASTVAAMSPAEQARSDASRIDVMDDLRPDEQGDFATSRDFIRRFVGRLPGTEQAGMIDAGGQLSSAGYARVRNAVLAKAYGNSPILTRMVESMDDSLRNVSKALMIAAPRVAQARMAMGDGRLFDADITPHLISAVEELGRLKDSGGSVQDALAQAGLMGDQYSAETRELLQFLADNMRRPRRMAEFVTAYFDALEAAGDPAQGSLLGETAPPTTGDLMTAARRTTEEAPSGTTAKDTKRRDAGTPAQDGASDGRQPEAAPSDRRGDQGDEAANQPVGPDWVAFGPGSKSLGIPRAQMPQVKMKDRGALVQFLKARGIEHEIVEVDPATISPTQAEFSVSKTERAKTAEGDTATALISSDDYVLDGHHRWLAQEANGEPLRALRFNAPIRDLLAAVREFPSATTSDQSTKGPAALDPRTAVIEDLRAAMGDLADILTRHTRAAMVPETTPELMATLKRIASDVIAWAGMDARRIIAGMRAAMKADPLLKKLHGKIETATLRKAAEEAIADMQKSGTAQKQGDLFSAPEVEQLMQGDLFLSAEPAPAEPAQPDAGELILGKDAPPKDKPIVLVFGGTFNPIHKGHVKAATDARKLLTDAGYKVQTVIVSPSPQNLIEAKSGAGASMLIDRTAMADIAFKEAGLEGFTVTDQPSREADSFKGKLKRTQQADWARKRYPGATVVSLAGQDSAPGSPPGFPSVYQGDPGTSHEGYFYLAVPRDEASADNISSSAIKKKIAAGEAVPESWEFPEVVRYFNASRGAGDEITLNGRIFGLDAPHFGLPLPATPLPDGHALLTPTSELKTVTLHGLTVPRARFHAHIVDRLFRRATPVVGRKPVAYLMGGGGASGKGTVLAQLQRDGTIPSANVVHIDADNIKRRLPEYNAILKAGDSRGAGIAHEESSDLSKAALTRARDGGYDLILDAALGSPDKATKMIADLKAKGYEVRLFGVTADPALAVMRMASRATTPGKDYGRWVPPSEMLKAHKQFTPAFAGYAELVDSAVLIDTTDTQRVLAEKQPGGVLQIQRQEQYNGAVERSGKIYEGSQSYRGIREGVERTDRLGRQDQLDQGGSRRGGSERGVRGGADAGNVPGGQGRAGEAGGQAPGTGEARGPVGDGNDGTDANDRAGAEGQAAGPARQPEGQRQAASVRRGSGAGDRVAGRGPDDGAAPGREVGRPGPAGKRGPDADGAVDQPRGAPGPRAGVPAGRDIGAKSGLNYRFADDDISPPGSWRKRAAWNIDAVEIVKKLQAEGRKATREEQQTLAKFVGWGASEIANNLFGAKLDKAADTMEAYGRAVEAFEKRGNTPMRKDPYAGYRGTPDGWHSAVTVMMAANPGSTYYTYSEITREQLDKAAPAKDTRAWLAMRDRLRKLLTEDELAEAARSTQYGHYTSAGIVRGMWGALERFGFKGGVVLEPGGGKGNFPGLMPDAMAVNSSYTGIEYDAITGAILGYLFPDERILVESYVDTKLPKNFYDVGIGNPPFSGTKILTDNEYKKHAFSLHDYFFAKTLDRVKPGGILMFVTSRYTMDKAGDKARQYLAERADLVGAIRLPQTAFKENAGTEVVTDVLFLRKKVPGETFEHGQAWLGVKPIKTSDGKDAIVNEYFAAHPEMVLGKQALTGSMYSKNEYTVLPPDGDMETLFRQAVEKMPEGIYKAARGSAAEAAQVREIDFNPKAKKEGNYYVTDAGVLMQREGGIGQRVQLRSPKDVELIKDFVPLRDALKQAHYDQLNGGAWEASLATLQAAYKTFTAKHGFINQFTEKDVKVKVDELDEDGNKTGRKLDDEETRRSYPLLKKIENDPDWSVVAALEKINDDTGAITPGAFLTSRVLGKVEPVRIETPGDALLTVLNDTGAVDVPAIAYHLGVTEQDAIESLGSAIYQDPEGAWTTADEYLSGNVKRKLKVARAAAKADRRFERNVTALEEVQPAPKSPSQISPSIGMNWIPGTDYERFLKETANVEAEVRWNENTRQWSVTELRGGKLLSATADWGTDRRNATDLLEHALTGRQIRITDTVGRGADKKTVFNAPATEAANQKLDALRKEFEAWIWRDSERADRLVQVYNDRFNTTVARAFDGRHLTLPGASKQFNIFDHVKRGAWRIIQRGNTYLAHAVGSGKTFQMVISAMEQKRLGLIKKPMMVVPNHMLQQFAREWQELYPAARLMIADENNFHTDNRRRFVSRVALSDLDGVIITHSAFKLLDLDPKFKEKIIEEQLVYMRAALEEAQAADTGSGRKPPTVKQIEKQIENLEQKLEAALSGEGKDQNVRFDELGVDMLYVDEAHEFRKLDFATARQVKGIQPAGSARALDLYIKARYLDEKNPGRSLVMASGTAITNTLAELYSIQRFMARGELEEQGLQDFDSWAAQFGREKVDLEPDAAGKYAPVSRFQRFVNAGALSRAFRDFADVVTGDQLAALLGDKRPKVEGGSRTMVVTPKTSDYKVYQAILADRVKKSRDWKPSKDEPNNPDPMIRIIGDGRLAAIDGRFVFPDAPNNPDSKLNRMIDNIIKVYKETADFEYLDKAGNPEPNKGAAMMVFSDLGFGAGVAARRGFNARAWFEKRMRDAGIPPAHVAFMTDAKKSTEKAKLFKDVNAGRVRILVGSSKNMGTGVNAQQRLKALFHLDSPWFPADLEQREGRIVRQGNKNKLVSLFAYATKGTYDENMWKMLASKQYFIDQMMSGDGDLDEIEDLSAMSQYDLAAAMIADDPRVLQLAGAKAEIEKLNRLYRAHEDQRLNFRREYNHATLAVDMAEKVLPEAVAAADKIVDLSGENFRAKVGEASFDERAKWGQALLAEWIKRSAGLEEGSVIGEISGFPVQFNSLRGADNYRARIMLGTPEPMELVSQGDESAIGIAMRAQNALSDITRMPAKLRDTISAGRARIDALRERLNAPFPMAAMLADKIKEAEALEVELAKVGTDAVDADETLDEESALAAAALGMAGPELRLSRGAGSGMDQRQLQAIAARVSKSLPGLPKVNVLASPADAPQALRAFIERRGAMRDAEGALFEGQIYLFASGLADAQRAEHVLAEHEAAHAGLRGLLGDGVKQAMTAIYNQNLSVRTAADALRKAQGMDLAEAVEEVIVEIPSKELAKLAGWRRLVARMRDALRGRGFTALADQLDRWMAGYLTNDQRADLFVADLVREARAFVAGKRTRKLADDAASQEKWLTERAKGLGYADIEALLEADYPAFERLAGEWRERNPAAALLSRSNRLFHTTRAGNIESIAREGLVPGKAARHAGVSSASRVSLAATEGAASYYGGPGDVLLRTAPGFVAADLEADALAGGDGAYTTGAPIPPAMLEARVGGKWMPLDQAAKAIASGARLDDPASAAKFSKGDKVVVPGGRDGVVKSIDSKAGSVTVKLGNGMTMAFLGDHVRLADARLSRAGTAAPQAPASADKRAEAIIQNAASTPKPLDAFARTLTRITGLERLTTTIYGQGARLIDRLVPERVKAGVVSDYGVPEAVIDQRARMQGTQREQLRQAGALIEKLASLTRAESRVAYEWMTGDDPRTADEIMADLPEESVKVLREVRALVDELSREAVRLGQLDPEAFERHRFAYLRRSYFKHTTELTGQEKTARQRAISILGDQYKGRGMTAKAAMRQIQNIAPEWWKRKVIDGKADTSLKGEKFERLERRAAKGVGTAPLEGMGENTRPGKLLEIHYWPAGEPKPAKYADWDSAGTWEVRSTKGGDAIMWRDFTKEERTRMGEIDEARFAIGKTLHRMIHDIEVGRYLEWLAQNHARKPGEQFAGTIVEASERYRDTFTSTEWVQVPDASIPGTSAKKYGKLAGLYLPGPIWNDLRQVVGGRFMPLGETYQSILRMWKISKTALSPGVHTNNVMSNFVMADWHDVSAGHVAKSLRIILGASERKGKGAIGRAGNVAGHLGIADREAAQAILTRYENSGGSIGGWVTQEIANEQMAPIVEALQKELNTTAANAAPAEIGVYSALQHTLHARFPQAWEAFKASRPATAVATDGANLIDLYQAEDDVFRLAAWLKAKEGGMTDAEAGKVARRSFLDYSINAPWVQALRSTALPFVSFTYRAVPMLLEVAGKRPHKIVKLMMLAGALNALGWLLAGGDDDEDEIRKLLPEEKAGRLWGMVPKLIRMPWNDANGSPVFLDVRRWVPAGDVFDLGQGHAAVPLPPSLMPGGPLAVMAEVIFNKSMFTAKPITLETDTNVEAAGKVMDHLWKAAAPNILGLPNTYATTGVAEAVQGRTDAFGREMSVPQAIASTAGVKLGSYPTDVLRRNVVARRNAQVSEIDLQISQLKRQRQTQRIDQQEFEEKVQAQVAKKRKVMEEAAAKLN